MPEWTYRTLSGKTMSQLLNEYSEERAIPAIGKALYLEATGIIEESKPLVPVDTGTLRASAFVADPEFSGDAISVEFGYGGPAALINPKSGESTDVYALRVHEDLNAFHKVGTAKFLELPFFQAIRGMSQRVIDTVRREL